MKSNFQKMKSNESFDNLPNNESQIKNKDFYQKYQNEISPKEKRKELFSDFDRKIRRSGFQLLITGIIAIFLFFSNMTPDIDESARKAALKDGQSSQLIIGAKLTEADENNMESKDYTITHSSNLDNTTIWIWDYADVDGDYVQVFADGVPITDAFMIKNKVVQLKVPSNGEIQVLGVKDGVGGISYAIHFELNGTTYFNKANVGESNTYTLIGNN